MPCVRSSTGRRTNPSRRAKSSSAVVGNTRLNTVCTNLTVLSHLTVECTRRRCVWHTFRIAIRVNHAMFANYTVQIADFRRRWCVVRDAFRSILINHAMIANFAVQIACYRGALFSIHAFVAGSAKKTWKASASARLFTNAGAKYWWFSAFLFTNWRAVGPLLAVWALWPAIGGGIHATSGVVPSESRFARAKRFCNGTRCLRANGRSGMAALGVARRTLRRYLIRSTFLAVIFGSWGNDEKYADYRRENDQLSCHQHFERLCT